MRRRRTTHIRYKRHHTALATVALSNHHLDKVSKTTTAVHATMGKLEVHQLPLVDLLFDRQLRMRLPASTLEGIALQSKEISGRANIQRYLLELTANPYNLLCTMLLTNTFLVGSRALEFFKPGVVTCESDWDFVCCGSFVQRRAFLEYMVHQGLKINKEHGELSDTGYPGSVFTIEGRFPAPSRTHTVQLISVSYVNELDVIARHHSSILWCFITGAEAVCVNPWAVSLGISTYSPTSTSAHLGREKYVQRGIRYYDLHELGTLVHEKEVEKDTPFGAITCPIGTECDQAFLDYRGFLHIPVKHHDDQSWTKHLVDHRQQLVRNCAWSVCPREDSTHRVDTRCNYPQPRTVEYIPGGPLDAADRRYLFSMLQDLFSKRGYKLVFPQHTKFSLARRESAEKTPQQEGVVNADSPTGGLEYHFLQTWVVEVAPGSGSCGLI